MIVQQLVIGEPAGHGRIEQHFSRFCWPADSVHDGANSVTTITIKAFGLRNPSNMVPACALNVLQHVLQRYRARCFSWLMTLPSPFFSPIFLYSPSYPLAQRRTLLRSIPRGHHYVTEIFVLRGLFDLGQAAQRLLQETMQVLAQKSVARSEAVCQECLFMEQRYQRLSQDLMMMLWEAPALSALQRDTSILQRIAQVLWMAHELRRLARYAESICTHIVFIMRGKS